MKKEQKINKKDILCAFLKEEKGVYSLMMALVSTVLLSFMALGFESSAMLLDKARLSDTLEQASLALTAENNEKRRDRYKISDPETRNNQIVLAYLEAYMPKSDPGKNGQIFAKDSGKEPIINIKSHVIEEETGYDLSVSITRKSILPFKLTGDQVVPEEITMGMSSSAIKKKETPIPIDLMLVADYSSSMESRLSGDSRSKITILREVVNELANDHLFTQKDGVKNDNRIAIATFTLGGQQFGDNPEYCVIPFDFGGDEDDFMPSIENYSSWNDYTRILKEMPEELNVPKTVNYIDSFNGEPIRYKTQFKKNSLCMRNNLMRNSISNQPGKSSSPWFKYDHRSAFKSFVNEIRPGGSTLVGAGLLIGANAILNDTNENAQRIILVLSDGDDAVADPSRAREKEFGEMTDRLIYGKTKRGSEVADSNYAMCDRIRKRIDDYVYKEKHKDANLKIPSKIAFVAFGTKPAKKAAWKHCVGDGNYYEANSKVELMKAFTQVVNGRPEEVGYSQ